MSLSNNEFLPAGYMGKFIVNKTNWIKNPKVEKIYSVSNCISKDFTDYISLWQHNKFWFFDRIETIAEICNARNLDLNSFEILYYEMYQFQFKEDEKTWNPIIFDDTLETNVQIPKQITCLGYDIVNYFAGAAPECSILSCNGVCDEIEVNQNCLIQEFNTAKKVVEKLKNCEPGPYRIIKVNTC